MAEIVGPVVGHRQRVRPFGAGRAERDPRLIAEAHGVDFHLLVRIDAVRALVGHLDPHDRAAARHARLDDHAGLGGHADRQQRAGHAAIGRLHVQAGVDDVAADRVVRRGAVAVLMLHPERIVRDVGPAMIVGIGKAGVARQAERKIDEPVLAGDAAVAMVAVEQVLDDQLRLGIHAVHFPDLLAVFRNVGLAVLGAEADLIHHGLEKSLADLAQQLSVLVEDLHVRRLERIGLRTAEQHARNRDPEIAVLVDRRRRPACRARP